MMIALIIWLVFLAGCTVWLYARTANHRWDIQDLRWQIKNLKLDAYNDAREHIARTLELNGDVTAALKVRRVQRPQENTER